MTTETIARWLKHWKRTVQIWNRPFDPCAIYTPEPCPF